MRIRVMVAAFVLAAGCVNTVAQPVVAPDGVMNAASYTLPALPYSGIAQGSMFVVFGENLGPRQLVSAPSLPLPPELAGTSIQVTVGGTTATAFMLYSYASQIAAILPSATPVGTGQLTVTSGGRVSNPVSIKVVKTAPGIFTRNQAGSGPAIIQNYVSPAEMPVNALTEAAAPGQIAVIWGTGLGPINGDDSNVPPVGNLPVETEVLVAGKSANLLYWGRSPSFAGIDQINFEIPAGIEGCRVPVVLKAGGVLSNFVTIAISSSGKTCSDPAGFSAADLGNIVAKGDARIGSVNLGRVFSQLPESETSHAGAHFFRRNAAEILASFGVTELTTAAGACTVNSFRMQDQMQWLPNDPVNRDPLDAGAVLNLNGPSGPQQIALSGKGQYDSQLTATLPPGEYSVDNGAGGADVGPFRATVRIPEPFTWANRDSIDVIPRNRDLTVNWTGGNPAGEYVLIVGAALETNWGIVSSFVCSERAAAGTFKVPAAILSALPPATAMAEYPTGIVSVSVQPLAEFAKFTASGLDVGYLQYTIEYIKAVRFQ